MTNGTVNTVAATVVEHHLYARYTGGFARILHAVRVVVEPDPVADTGGGVNAEIPTGVILAKVKRGADGLEGDAVGIGVECVVATGIALTRAVAARQAKFDVVIAWHKPSEGINAGGIGGGTRHRRTAPRPIEPHVHVTHAGFASILHAVKVIVVPDPVAEAGKGEEAEVPTRVIFTRRQTRHCRAVRHHIGVAIGAVVVPNVLRAGRVAGRQRPEDEIVVARNDIGEAVEAGRRQGRRGDDHGAATGVELDRHPAEAWFARILHPVAVEIIPDEIADAGPWPNQPRIPAQISLIQRKRDDICGAIRRIGVGVERIIAALVTTSETVARRQPAEAHPVRARAQLTKTIGAVTIGGRRG